MSNIDLFLAIFAALFSVVNPLGAMPVFLSMTVQETPQVRTQIALKTAIYFIGILVVSFLAGQYVLNFFGISIEAIRIAGGLIIMSSGYALLNGKFVESRSISKKVKKEALLKDNIAFSPLALPLLSGPGSIALLIGLKSQQEIILQNVITIIAIILIGLLTYMLLRFSQKLVDILGQSGMNSIARIMGFIVMSIGIQYLITALVVVFKS